MSQTFVHPHAEFDRFPALAEEFGADVIADIIAAEAADFAWDSRFAERNLGAWDGFEDEDFDAEMVRIIGYFRSRYIVATCLVDDDFKPKLGKIRAGGGTRGRKFLHQVLAAANRAGGSSPDARTSKFHGGQIGRGAGIGRMLSSRDRHAAFRSRRVVVKSRIVKLAGKGVAGAKAHLRYIQRDGVTRDGAPGQLYGAEQDRVDGKPFLDRAEGDRHQFRFIVAPEDGDQYDDLKPLTRRLMAQMEQDLGTRLDWVAVDHYNTGHPHSHIIVRGRDDRGRDLVVKSQEVAHSI